MELIGVILILNSAIARKIINIILGEGYYKTEFIFLGV